MQDEGITSDEVRTRTINPQRRIGAFSKFDAVSYQALYKINEREGENELKKARRQERRKRRNV